MEELHENEEWKPVVGFENRYLISNMGRARSLSKVHWMMKHPHLKMQVNANGYGFYSLWNGTKDLNRMAHRLVLMAFVGPPPDEHECAHLDGDRLNNKLANLKWCTRKENIAHKLDHGTYQWGEMHPSAKLNLEIARDIRRQLAPYPPKTRAYSKVVTELAAKLDVKRSQINRIAKGRSWVDPVKDPLSAEGIEERNVAAYEAWSREFFAKYGAKPGPRESWMAALAEIAALVKDKS